MSIKVSGKFLDWLMHVVVVLMVLGIFSGGAVLVVYSVSVSEQEYNRKIEYLETVKPYVTTKKEVIEKLGKPNNSDIAFGEATLYYQGFGDKYIVVITDNKVVIWWQVNRK